MYLTRKKEDDKYSKQKMVGQKGKKEQCPLDQGIKTFFFFFLHYREQPHAGVKSPHIKRPL